VKRPEIWAVVVSGDPLPAAQKRAVDEAYLRDQLGRLGNTPYELADLTLDVSGSPFAPASLLNQMRRDAVDALQEQQTARPDPKIVDPDRVVNETRSPFFQKETPSPTASLGEGLGVRAELHLLVRTPAQLDAALALCPASITLDYLELYGLRPAVERVQAAGIPVRVASPRILKPGEQGVSHFLQRLGVPILVRPAGLLHALREMDHPPLTGDFSLNAANALTALTFLNLGLERITPTHDLNGQQVTDLAKEVGPERVEVIGYQHLPVFHTEHCVFCRFLSAGTSYKDCGHPCEEHKVALRDSNGRRHPVMADVGCRNTVFGAEAQEASHHLESWLAAGIRHVRLEFVHESPAEVTAVGQAFNAFFAKKTDATQLGQRLRSISPEGTTEGSLFVPGDFMEIPLMG
jgi:putative protease